MQAHAVCTIDVLFAHYFIIGSVSLFHFLLAGADGNAFRSYRNIILKGDGGENVSFRVGGKPDFVMIVIINGILDIISYKTSPPANPQTKTIKYIKTGGKSAYFVKR